MRLQTKMGSSTPKPPFRKPRAYNHYTTMQRVYALISLGGSVLVVDTVLETYSFSFSICRLGQHKIHSLRRVWTELMTGFPP